MTTITSWAGVDNKNISRLCRFIYRSTKAGLGNPRSTSSTSSIHSTSNGSNSQRNSLPSTSSSSLQAQAQLATSASSGSRLSAGAPSTQSATTSGTGAFSEGIACANMASNAPVSPVPERISIGTGPSTTAEENVEKLAKMVLQLSLDLQNGIDYYEYSFDK